MAGSDPEGVGISRFLVLPRIPIRRSRRAAGEPLIDYSNSIILTSDNYLASMEQLAAKRDSVAKAKEQRKLEAEVRKRKREEEKLQRASKKKEVDATKAAKAREVAYWKEVAAKGWGNELQKFMKSGIPPPPGSYQGLYLGSVPTWCISNQRRRKLAMQQKRAAAVWQRGGGHGVEVGKCLEQASGGRSAEQANEGRSAEQASGGGGRSVEEGVFARV